MWEFLYLHIRYISREYGSGSYMKVTGSRSRSQEQKSRMSLFLHCKTLVASSSGSVKDRAMRFMCIMGFSARSRKSHGNGNSFWTTTGSGNGNNVMGMGMAHV